MAEKEMKQKQKAKKGGKKRFFEVTAPLTATKIFLYGSEEQELDGKTVKLDLTKSLRGKSLELKFRILNNKGTLEGIPESIELNSSYIRRVMRKSADYCEDSLEIECRDAITRIKPLFITRKRVSRGILRSLREESKEFISTYCKTRTSHELFSEIMTNRFQKQLSLKLKKIYPLALCEIRMFEILKEK